MTVILTVNGLDKIVSIGICTCNKCGSEICEEGKFSKPNCCSACFSVNFNVNIYSRLTSPPPPSPLPLHPHTLHSNPLSIHSIIYNI